MTDQHQQAPRDRKDHDGNYKLIFGDPVTVREFLEDFGPPEIVRTLDFSTLERLPTEHVDRRTRKQRKNDMLWRVRRKDGSPCYVAIILEFQSRREPDMALKILVYSALFLQELAGTEEARLHGLPALLPFMIYNGPGDWDEAEEVADLFAPMDKALEPFNPRQRYIPIKVMSLPEESLAGKGIAAQVFRMEQSRDPRRLDELVLETARRFDDEKYENARQVIAGWLGDVVVERMDIPPEMVPKIHTLKGVHNMLAYNLDAWVAKRIQEGEVRGLARGRAEGLTEGEVKTARCMVGDALNARFGGASEAVKARLEAIGDFEVLRRLGVAVWQAQSLEDFIARLPDDGRA